MAPVNTVPEAQWESFGVSRESLTRLDVLVRLVLEWQPYINLISPTTMGDIWTRHIFDSVQLLSFISADVTAIADLGSGGGFPGLALAACHPAKVHMFESNGKKAAFLQEGLRCMKVKGEVHRERLIPRKAPIGMPDVQLVTARAFAPLEELVGYAEPFLQRGAYALFHKGQDVDAELTQAAKSWKISAQKHSSQTDSKSVILEIKEVSYVGSKQFHQAPDPGGG